MSELVRGVIVWALFGGSSALAGISIEPVCTDPEDVSEAVFTEVLEQTGAFFPIEDEGVCAKVVKAAVAACHKAVSDAAGCSSDVFAGIVKTGKAVCATAVDKAACNESFTDVQEEQEEALGFSTSNAHEECDTELAGALFGACTEAALTR